MSKLLKISFSLFALCALGWTGASTFDSYQTSKSQTRTLANLRNQSTIMMEKHLMPVTVSLVGPEEFPEGPDEPVVIRAHIKTPFDDFSNIQYKWSIPGDVEIVQGHVTGVINSPVAGHVHTLEMTLKNFDKQFRKEITLEAFVIDAEGTHLGYTANITSRPEDSMEHLAPVMMVKAQEFAEENARLPASADKQ